MSSNKRTAQPFSSPLGQAPQPPPQQPRNSGQFQGESQQGNSNTYVMSQNNSGMQPGAAQGQSQIGPNGQSQMAPNGQSQMAPNGQSQMASNGQSQMVPNGQSRRPRPRRSRPVRQQQQQPTSGNGNGSDDDEQTEDQQQERYVYYKSPEICCCDLQTALTSMACVDIVIAFICIIVFISLLAGPRPPPSEHRVVHVRHHHGFHEHWHHPRFRRAAGNETAGTTTATGKPDETTTTTTGKPDETTTTTTGKPDESPSYKMFAMLGLIISVLMLVCSIGLTIAAVNSKKTLCWVTLLIGWIIYLGAFVFYCILVSGSENPNGNWSSISALVLVLIYRIYETVVVYYFVKEPPPRPIRYVADDTGVTYVNAPQRVYYEPAYGYGYGYGPYYGGYGYGAGLGLASGIGLGLALDHGFHHDYYDYDYF